MRITTRKRCRGKKSEPLKSGSHRIQSFFLYFSSFFSSIPFHCLKCVLRRTTSIWILFVLLILFYLALFVALCKKMLWTCTSHLKIVDKFFGYTVHCTFCGLIKTKRRKIQESTGSWMCIWCIIIITLFRSPEFFLNFISLLFWFSSSPSSSTFSFKIIIIFQSLHVLNLLYKLSTYSSHRR